MSSETVCCKEIDGIQEEIFREAPQNHRHNQSGMFAHKTTAIMIQHQYCGARERLSITRFASTLATYQAKLVLEQIMPQAKASVVSPFPSVYQYTVDTDRHHHSSCAALCDS